MKQIEVLDSQKNFSKIEKLFTRLGKYIRLAKAISSTKTVFSESMQMLKLLLIIIELPNYCNHVEINNSCIKWTRDHD